MSNVSTQAKAWYWQRASAIYASRRGLTAAQILGRTRGNVAFAAFYTLFVGACAIHVPIGLKSIAEEWLRWRGRGVAVAAIFVAFAILVLGLRAVYAVVG